MTWSPTPPPRATRPGDVPPAHAAPSATAPSVPIRRRRIRLALVALALVAALALAFTAGGQFERQTSARSGAATLTARERASDIGTALDRPRRAADLPVGYQAGPDLPYPGDSYRLLYDESPHAAADAPRWRVWVGEGVDASQLCVVAAYTEVQELVDCYPAAQLYTGTFTVASPVGSAPLAINVVSGDVIVNGHAVRR
ncbi:hypothetical protein [Frondihabitans australicus]|uniref:Uncharacterized protein n=1 Tax=Frondihabitans australicus TaxID=386892 RepID=A0A495IJN7_9MICO|nr:hypothetical protein [Frondihabitans australicus]RKR75335.1 hypothetical protein C8E83_2476 [Frondihabitans australicus]